MKKVMLYVGGAKVDLNGQDLILMNWAQNDLTNPTVVKNNYSKQIELEGTPANNAIFAGMIRLDRKTIYSEEYTGISFDPMRRTPFALYDDMLALLESGYIKLNSVKRSGSHFTYSVTLYGGLGAFFYSLSYKEDGTKKTLADLDFGQQRDEQNPTGFGLASALKASDVMDAWDVMGGADPAGKRNAFWNIVNFAPCYNGLPADFDSNKACTVGGRYENVPGIKVEDGVQYGWKAGAHSHLMTFTNKHTEWEIGDLRCYLQRPVVCLREIIDACGRPGNNGGYTMELKGRFFHKDPQGDQDNRIYLASWVTLPMISSDKRKSTDALVYLMQGTLSPAEYLLSFAKMCGLYFVYDNAQHVVTLMDRDEFYNDSEVMDITERIDLSSGMQVQPVAAVAKYYQLGGEALGEFAKSYAEKYGRAYGIQRINTGYDFDGADNMLTDGMGFKAAPDVMEFSRMYGPNKFSRDDHGGTEEYFILSQYEAVKVKLWGTKEGDTEQSSIDVNVAPPLWGTQVWDNPDFPMGDFLPKVQLHEEENKAIDGANVLLMFNGLKDIPKLGAAGGPADGTRFVLSDDPVDIGILNEGVPCWNLTDIPMPLFRIPSFRRFYMFGTQVVWSLEWGVPLELGDPSITSIGDQCIYRDGWRAYLTDLLSPDTMVMKCKVNLSGLDVGQQLLRRFFWYGGSLWVLNSIANHSLTTNDLTECEFIRVQDTNNYNNGQHWG